MHQVVTSWVSRFRFDLMNPCAVWIFWILDANKNRKIVWIGKFKHKHFFYRIPTMEQCPVQTFLISASHFHQKSIMSCQKLLLLVLRFIAVQHGPCWRLLCTCFTGFLHIPPWAKRHLQRTCSCGTLFFLRGTVFQPPIEMPSKLLNLTLFLKWCFTPV